MTLKLRRGGVALGPGLGGVRCPRGVEGTESAAGSRERGGEGGESGEGAGPARGVEGSLLTGDAELCAESGGRGERGGAERDGVACCGGRPMPANVSVTPCCMLLLLLLLLCVLLREGVACGDGSAKGLDGIERVWCCLLKDGEWQALGVEGTAAW